MRKLTAAIRLARPKQWVKNIFVFAALIFAGKVTDTIAVLDTLLAFTAFCFASSAIYYLNDFRDVEEDRKHPKKCKRPLAAGELPPWVGVAGFIYLSIMAIAIPGMLLSPLTTTIVVSYLLLNLGYSLGLKHLVILDVLIIAAGFVMRILAGAAAISVIPSAWLVLCGVTISLFLGFTKRRHEVMLLGDRKHEHRKVLADYSETFLDQMIAIVTAATVVLYALYTVDKQVVDLVGSRSLLLTVPLVLYGIFRYLYLVYHTSAGGDPTRTVFTDVPLLVTGALWGLLCMGIILYGKDLGAYLF